VNVYHIYIRGSRRGARQVGPARKVRPARKIAGGAGFRANGVAARRRLPCGRPVLHMVEAWALHQGWEDLSGRFDASAPAPWVSRAVCGAAMRGRGRLCCEATSARPDHAAGRNREWRPRAHRRAAAQIDGARTRARPECAAVSLLNSSFGIETRGHTWLAASVTVSTRAHHGAGGGASGAPKQEGARTRCSVSRVRSGSDWPARS